MKNHFEGWRSSSCRWRYARRYVNERLYFWRKSSDKRWMIKLANKNLIKSFQKWEKSIRTTGSEEFFPYKFPFPNFYVSFLFPFESFSLTIRSYCRGLERFTFAFPELWKAKSVTWINIDELYCLTVSRLCCVTCFGIIQFSSCTQDSAQDFSLKFQLQIFTFLHSHLSI